MSNPLLSEIAYHDYVAMVCFLENVGAIRLVQRQNASSISASHQNQNKRSIVDAFSKVSEDFTTACCDYRDRVNRNREGFNRANPGERELPEFARYLYNPACYGAFGRANAVGIVLLDDFDPMASITAEIASPIDQAALAFCPKMESQGFSRPFYEPHELFDGELPALSPQPDGTPGKRRYRPSIHSFQSNSPLLAVTRCKLGGLATLSCGLLFQQAIYRAGFASWLSPRNASLGYAIAFVMLWYGILRVMERRGWVLRV